MTTTTKPSLSAAFKDLLWQHMQATGQSEGDARWDLAAELISYLELPPEFNATCAEITARPTTPCPNYPELFES